MNKSVNVRQLLINEISLEGLDGITLQALWLRISETTSTTLPYPERLEQEYWQNICKLPNFEFYELEKPRPDLVTFNRFSATLDDAVPLEEYPEDIYPHKLVNDTKKGIIGSCATYNTRKNITEQARKTEYTKVKKKWGSKLVIVASQDLRNRALMGESNKVEITPIQYCILERIGRSRYQGEITQGKRSLQAVGEDPKSLFYHRKTLLKHKFITKQFYHVKSGSENCSGSLLHLTRFYVEKKSKFLLLTEKAVEYLKTKPNYRAEYADLKKHLNLSDAARKVFKFADFQRFIQTDVKIPYRELYPNSTQTEWKQKNTDKEKTVRVLQLIDPDVDVAENWYLRHNNDEQGDEDDDELGFKNYENLCLGQSVLSQGAAIVCSFGENGITQSELGQTMGLGKLNTRSLCRSLLKRNVVTCIMHDVGRQRVTRFVSRKFENKGQMTRQFKQEKERMMTLLSSQKSENNNAKKENTPNKSDNANTNANKKTQIEPIPSTSKCPPQNIDLNETDDCIMPPNKRIKLTEDITTNTDTPIKINNTQSNARKRKLFGPEDTLNGIEPNAKIAKLEQIQMTEDIQENIDKIVVDITVTKHDATLKGYSQGFEDQIQSDMMSNKVTKGTGGSLTYRILKRANFIIECVRQYKVIADLQKLMKMIQEEEQDEGYLVKIDKKSLVRLLLKLAKEGHVKYMKANLTNDARTKTIAFVCDPSIDETHSLIQSEIEQAKMKFFIGYAKKEEKGKMRPVKKKYTFDKKIAKELGFCPKFVRMRLTHELLFYLVYEQDKNEEPITTVDDKREWCQKMQLQIDDSVINEMSPIYYKRELCWKTFIPPLPVHIGWPQGWTLISDVLVRLPFHTFMQCCSATHNVEGIQDYVNHPIRQFYLVRDLPLNVRNDLLYKRKYIFQMHEIISRLGYTGLVQFGPQKFKEKDQVFVYINRRSSILDTTTSKHGYHEISAEVYDKHEYTFENLTDLEHYWYDLWHTCMNTRLGGRSCVTGKYLLIEQLETKPAMVEALAPTLPEMAEAKDNGSVPGNSRGAAGLDSAFFAHLKRNWSWHSASQMFDQTPKPPQNPKKKRIVETIKIPDPKNESEMIEIEVKKQTVAANTKQLNKNKKASTTTTATKTKRAALKPKSVIRKIQPKTMPKRKPLYDEVDKMALAKMYKLRTDWSLVEDHILLLCNIASQYLFPNRRKQMISVSVYRDILHKLSKTSISKTSRACQRRILYTMKNVNTRRSVNMCLEEIRQNEKLKAKYENLIGRLQKGSIPELEMNITFIDLVCQLTVIFSNMMKSGKRRTHILLPSSIPEFYDKFHICVTPKKSKHSYNEPKTTDDIDFNVVKTVVHSSMCCTKDKTSWAYQLFKIYQQYPEHLLRSAVTKTRQEQLISLKKSFGLKKKSTMPLSSSPYKLSIMYYNHLLTKIPYGTYQDAYELLLNIGEHTNNLNPEETNNSRGLEIINPGCGVPVAIMELLEKVDIQFNFDIPDDIIVLDQNIKKDKTYERLVERFYSILKDPSRVQKWEEQFPNNDVEDEDNFPQIEQVQVQEQEQKTQIETSKKNPDAPLNVSRHVTTRIAFHIMRAEICEGLDDVSTQHLHDFFVVNACRVWINVPSVTNTGKQIDIEDFCEEYKEVKTVLTPNLLTSIKTNAILPIECPKHEQIIKNIHDNDGNNYDVEMADTLIQYIESCNLFGATLSELKPMLIVKHEGNITALDILEILVNVRIIIKTGIEKLRYVHFNYKKHWIINSYKILRLEREKIPPITSPSKEEIQEHMRKHKKNFSYHELQKSKLRLDLNSQQEIKVLISPWIRIDGSLNRRVLDRWLGTVLIQLLEKPGISLHAVTQKFHYMKPVDVISMIHYLMTLKCIKQYTVQKTKATLFSSIPAMTLVPATGLEDPKDILLEPYYDAVTKLSIFIGKKAYATDFLMNYYF